MPETARPSEPRANEAQSADEVAVRLMLVDRFNEIVGTPNRIVRSMQRHFIAGNLKYDEMEAFFSLYERVIHAVESARRP